MLNLIISIRDIYIISNLKTSQNRKIDQADFTDWMSFLTSNLIWKESVLIQKPSAQIPKAFQQHGLLMKTWWFRYKCFSIA